MEREGSLRLDRGDGEEPACLAEGPILHQAQIPANFYRAPLVIRWMSDDMVLAG